MIDSSVQVMRKNNLHLPNGNLNSVLYYNYIDGYKNAFLTKHEIVKSWREVAKPYKIHPNMARMIANGYDPGNRIRERLQLPEKQPVEICEECGKILSKYHKCKSDPRPPRISIRLDNPESAARSIQEHMAREMISKLVELLIEEAG